MAAPTPPPLDPVSLLAAGFAGVLAPQIGHQAAAYVVIVASSLMGALWALSRREPGVGSPGWLYVVMVTGSTSLVAAGASEALAEWMDLSVVWLVAPVSLAIAAVGHDWATAHRWGPDLAGKLLDIAQRVRGGARK